MHVHRGNRAGLAGLVLDVLRMLRQGEETIRLLVEPGRPWTEELTAAITQREELLSFADGDDALFNADVAITGVEAAIAETCSLICASSPDRWRSTSLLPPAHIAIIEPHQIVPDLVDFITADRLSAGGAAITLITGPSKTADVEGILITGVHGPGAVHVIVLDG